MEPAAPAPVPLERALVEVVVNHGTHRRGQQFVTSLTEQVQQRIRSGYLMYLEPAAPASPPRVTVLDPT